MDVAEFLRKAGEEERAEQSAAQVSVMACQIAAGTIKISVKSVITKRLKIRLTRKEILGSVKRDFRACKFIVGKKKVEPDDAADSMAASELPANYPHEIFVQDELFRFRSYAEVSSLLLGSVSSYSATQVCVVDLAGQGFGDYRVIQILNRMYGLQLKHVSLARNGLTDETLFRLAVILPSLTQLQSLNLSGNKIGDIGIRTIFREGVLPQSLKHLDLSTNCIGHSAAYYIGRLFATEQLKQLHLESLFLGGNRIQGGSVDFMRILVSFMAGSSNKLLYQLGVPFMSFADTAGIKTLAAFVACNGAIVDLNVSNNPFLTGDCYSFFRWSVACNPSIRNVFLGQCGLSQFDKSLILSAISSTYKLSWSERTRLSILVSQELSKCAFSRYLLEYKVMGNWKAERPIDWQDGLPFLDSDYDINSFPPLLRPPWPCDSSGESAIPSFLTNLVNCVNSAWTLMTYLEGIFSECEDAEVFHGRIANRMDESNASAFRAERIFTSAELRQKKERVVAANLLLRDFKYDANANDKQATELLCMSLEDLLSSLVHHERSLSSKIVRMYSNELDRRFDCALRDTEAFHEVLCRHIPFYRYLGDAALYIHLLYVARPLKVALRRRAAAEYAEKLAGQDRSTSRKASARKSKKASSKTVEDIAILNKELPTTQRAMYRFIPNDRGLFVKLAILRLEPSEGERALFSGSRANQRFVANAIKIACSEQQTISVAVEQEAERGRLRHLSIHNINVVERVAMAADRAEALSERRFSLRMSDLSI